MIRFAYWTCALLALAHARVYERCELARELAGLGVEREHLSTWVCITYHESRFDTAAQNHYSGDHGLFQISELYWCGPGKACGLPCSALRDEDISNDLECALRIHEEHTRLQGDGFLAWVVYPQHCKHNTKKYIVDCDSQLKNATVRTPSRSRAFSNSYIKSANFEYNANIDNLLPPYLAVNSIVRGAHGKVLQNKNNQNSAPFNWLNYKIDNIDELTLPVFDKRFEGFPKFISTTTTTSTTVAPTTSTSTTTAYPPIKVWRRIETNQFRKKQIVDKKPTPTKWLELGKPTNPVDFVTPTILVDTGIKSTSPASAVVHASTPETTTLSPLVVTPAPITNKPASFVYNTSIFKETTKWPAVYTLTTSSPMKTKETTTPFAFTTPTTYNPTTKPTPKPFTLSTLSTDSIRSKETTKPYVFTAPTAYPVTNKITTKPFIFTTPASNSLVTKETVKPFVFTKQSVNPITINLTTNPFIFTSSAPNPTTTAATTKSFIYNSPVANSILTKETIKPYIFTSRATSLSSATNEPTKKPFLFTTPAANSIITKGTIKPFIFTSRTSKPTTRHSFFTTPAPKYVTTKEIVKPFIFTQTINSTTIKPFIFTTAAAKPMSTTTTPFIFTTKTTTSRTTTENIRAGNSSYVFREYKPVTFTNVKPTQTSYKSTTEKATAKSSIPTERSTPFIFTTRATSRVPSEKNKSFKSFSFGSTPRPKTTFHFFEPSASTKHPPLSATESIAKTSFNYFQGSTKTIKPTVSTSSYRSLNDLSSPFNFSKSSRTSRLLSQSDTLASSFTNRPVTYTNKPLETQRAHVTTPTPFKSITTQSTASSKTTKSIFDLYLSPTQWPKLPTHKFPELGNSSFKLKIFSGGTTPAPLYNTRRSMPPH